MAQLGDRLRSYREGLGLSLEELGERVGASRQFVSRVELGDKAMPRHWLRGLPPEFTQMWIEDRTAAYEARLRREVEGE